MDDLGLDVHALLEQLGRALDLLAADLGHVDQALDALLDLDEQAEVGDVGHQAGDEGAHGVLARHLQPRIFGELLDAEGELLVLLVDSEHLGLDDVADLEDLARVADLLGPADVGHVDQAVDALLDADEHAELGDVLDGALKDGSFRVLLGHHVPGVGLDLLHAERDALLVGVDAEDNDLDLISGAHHLRGVPKLAGPAHLGDVHQSLDAGLKLHKGAVVGEVGDLAGEAGALRVLARDVLPGVAHQLLQAEGDLLALAVEVQDLEVQLVAEGDHFLGVADALPAHVGDVQKTVQPAEVDEHAVFGDVLDLALDHLAFAQGLKQGAALLAALLFEQNAAGNDDVAAATVDLQNLEVEVLSDQGVHVGHGPQINVGAGQKGLDSAEINGVAALDAADDASGDGAVLLLGILQAVEQLHALGLVAGEMDGAFVLVLVGHEDVHRVAHGHGHIALGVEELGHGDLPFALEVHVDEDVILPDLDHGAGHDGAFVQVSKIGLEVILKGILEIEVHFLI